MTQTQNESRTKEGDHTIDNSTLEADQALSKWWWCMDIISQYRAWSIPKVRALNEIFSAIFESERDEEKQDKVMGHFIELLDQVEQGLNNPNWVTIDPMIDESSGQQPSHDNPGVLAPTGTNQSVLEWARYGILGGGGSGGVEEHHTRVAEVDEYGAFNDSNDELDFRWKPRINVLKLPWRNQDVGWVEVIDPILQMTWWQLSLFSQDTKTIINDLQIATDKPPFPSSEWENIIYGYPIDLDKVYSSMSTGHFDAHVSSRDKEEGSTKSNKETGCSQKLVSNAGSWIITWNATCQAISFVSKHWEWELQLYGDHIMSLFAIHQGRNEAIIKYDRVVREEQTAQNAWTLQDFPKFTHLQLAVMYLMPGGSR